MTDEAWKRQLADKKEPPLPAWTKSFVTASSPKQLEE